ncbi:nesprin-1 [Trichonephila inaurata madagascariensis]|uniref:Nesprin-1 n=1 Tax=Trichonephila inaurata madagascariensis TaxID=2747483 RepID=A0A8X6WTF8_9ARAC|nr:nesprin-1 [Trichonephila inaurata madagascariensis]
MQLFQQTLALAMEEQMQYLKTAYDFRKEFEKLSESLNKWCDVAEKILDVSSVGKYFADISVYENQLSEIQKLGSQIHPTLLDDQVPLLENEIDSLKKKLSRVLNTADKIVTEVEVDCILWKEYRELFEKISNFLKTPIPAEKPNSISAINVSIKKLSHHIQEMQKNQAQINELNDKARSLNRKANVASADVINQQMSNINSQWQDRTCVLESQISALTDILSQWELYSELDKNVQSSLLTYERQLEDIMAAQSIGEDSLKVVLETPDRPLETTHSCKDEEDPVLNADLIESLELNLLNEVKKVGSVIGNLSSQSSGVLSYLNSLPNGSEAQKQIKNHLQDIRKRHQKLIADIESKLKQVQEENEAMKNLEEQITVIRDKIHKIEERIKLIDCYIDDLDAVDKTMTEVREEVTTITETVRTVTTETKESFREKNYSIPDTITKTLSSLELLSEATTTILEDKEREYKKARTIRLEYTEALDAVVAWLQKAQEQLQDKSNLPEVALECINVLISEVLPVKSKLDSVRRNGLLIAESTRSATEKQIIQNSITSLEDQMCKVESWLYEREVQLKEAVNALRQFLESQNFVQTWIQKVESYLQLDTEILSLQDAKQKLSDLQGFSKESGQVQQHIKNMTKRLEKIGEVCSTGDLSDMLDNIEQDESSTDSRLQEQLSLLQEMVEEWEQCERKIKEVALWVEKAKASLDSPHFKKRSLRDQLTTREKMMSDMSVQKTKVLMALEKLQVHLRTHISGQHQILTRGQSVQEELELLHSQVEKQCETLQLCVVQEDQYQQDSQSLKHAISQADHQLKLASSPSISVEDKEKLKELQQALKEQIQNYSKQINIIQGRIKDIHQTRSPDKDPFRAQIIPLPMSVFLPPPPKIYIPPESPHSPDTRRRPLSRELASVTERHYSKSPSSPTDLGISYAAMASGQNSPIKIHGRRSPYPKSFTPTFSSTPSELNESTIKKEFIAEKRYTEHSVPKSPKVTRREMKEPIKTQEKHSIREEKSTTTTTTNKQKIQEIKTPIVEEVKEETSQFEESKNVDGTSWASGFLSKPSYADILSGRSSPIPRSPSPPSSDSRPDDRFVTSSYQKEVTHTEKGDDITEKLEASAFKASAFTVSSEPIVEMPESPDLSRKKLGIKLPKSPFGSHFARSASPKFFDLKTRTPSPSPSGLKEFSESRVSSTSCF